MRKAELFLLLALCLSHALIDPPLQSVMEHNKAIAPQEVIHVNVFEEPERLPSLNNPTLFYYVKILTLNPAVNKSVVGNHPDLHPNLIILVAENHVSTLTEKNGRLEGYKGKIWLKQYTQSEIGWQGSNWYVTIGSDESGNATIGYQEGDEPVYTWLDPIPEVIGYEEPEEEGDGCTKTVITRTYGDLFTDSVTAYYSVDGLARSSGGSMTYETASQSVTLAENGSSITNPSEAPFKEPGWLCMLSSLSGYVLGGMVDLQCEDPLLSRASPYPSGVFNVTTRNITIVQPALNVSVYAYFRIPYHEHGISCSETDLGCECDEWDSDGYVTIGASDSDSYLVQNDYFSLLPYSPSFLNASANTSENPIYYFSLLSNSEAYKYYSKIDGKIGNAYYYQNFDVHSDAFGTQFIDAFPLGHADLLAEDPESANNYSGERRILKSINGRYLRSPTEINNLTYNYSNIYNNEEVYYNLTPGPHSIDLLFYSYWGNITEPTRIYSRMNTQLAVAAAPIGQGQAEVRCNLADRWGKPLAGKIIVMSLGGATRYATSDGSGMAREIFSVNGSVATASARFSGDDLYLPSDGSRIFGTGNPIDFGQGIRIDNPMIILLLGLLAGIGVMNMISPGNSVLPIGKFFPFAKGPEGKKMIRVKKGKELAVSVAMAVATGGAGAAAASKIGEEAVKKKAAEDAARKELEKRVKMEMDKGAGKEGIGKSASKKMDQTKTEKDLKKKKMQIGGGAPGKPGDDDKKPKRITKEEIAINKARYPGTYSLKEKYLDANEIETERVKVLKEKYQDPHAEEISRRVQESSNGVGNQAHHDFFLKNSEKLELKIIPDRHLNRFLIEHEGDLSPNDTLAITIDNTVYIRESGMNNEKYLQEVIKHEDYHPFSQLNYEKSSKIVEGFNEIMKYEDIMRDNGVSSELKNDICIIEGDYREYASQQYLMREIIGNDEYTVAHLVKGEKYLLQRFDEAAGKGEYEKIFNGRMSDGEKIKQLEEVVKQKMPGQAAQILDNAEKIRVEGKYDVR